MTSLRRLRRRDRGGVAILLVVAAIMVLTTLVTDLAFGSRVRVLTAYHERDELQAQYLSRSGISLYRLILTANKQLAKNSFLQTYAAMAGVPPNDALWRMIPFINTGLLRMLLVSDGDVSEEEATDFKQSGQVSEEVAAASREESAGHFSGRNFLDFSGDFSTEVRGEDCRINVNLFSTTPTDGLVQDTAVGQALAGLMSGEDNDQFLRDRNLDRWDLINNLRDWVDADNIVASGKGGYEDDFYNRLDSPYVAKNAKFDTLLEVRLVEGWQDDVWDRFGGQLTIFGSGQININCADDDVVKGLIRAYVTPTPSDSVMDRILEDLHAYQAIAAFKDGKDFMNWLKNEGYNVNTQVSSVVATKTTYFTLTSTGQAGGASVKSTVVLDYSSTDEGKIIYWRED